MLHDETEDYLPMIFINICCWQEFLLSFTGGDTGIAISKKAGMVPLQMELGGKDGCIILEDADLDLAAANIVKGGFSYRWMETVY